MIYSKEKMFSPALRLFSLWAPYHCGCLFFLCFLATMCIVFLILVFTDQFWFYKLKS